MNRMEIKINPDGVGSQNWGFDSFCSNWDLQIAFKITHFLFLIKWFCYLIFEL